MEVAMEEGGELEISGCTSTTTTTTTTVDDELVCTWNDWSPVVVDWGMFSGEDDFHGLIESMMDENQNGLDMMNTEPSYESISRNTTTSSDTPEADPNGEDMKGLRLVHLLMAAAEALTEANKSLDLARVILVRLKELVSPAAAGTNMERITAHFTNALQSILDASTSSGKNSVSHHHHHHHHHHPNEMLTAFQLLQDMSPSIKFAHFTANQAILEAVSGERRVHIIDYDIMEGMQWASLMQALVTQKDGTPSPHIRITAIARGSAKKSMMTVQETGRRLAAFASSVGQPFSFGQCRLDSDEMFRPAGVKLVKGEVVVVNCMLHLPHFSHRGEKSVASFLTGVRGFEPKVITVVEEELGGRGGEEGFVGRFMDVLHHYSAVYDSLEAGFPMQGTARGVVERVFLGPRIAGTVGRVYYRKMEERWGDWMKEMGFGRVGISFFNHCQARLLLGLFNDGYRVEEDGVNKLVLGWKSRRLLSASVWSPSPSGGGGGPSRGPSRSLSPPSETTHAEDSDFLI